MSQHTLHEEVEEIIHHAEDAIHDVLEGLSEEDLLSHSTHQKAEHVILLLRNIAVGAAVILFLISLFHVPFRYPLKAIAYFLGAGAYCTEILLLTDCFSSRVPHQEMFMAYCFGPMYILLGLSYLLGH